MPKPHRTAVVAGLAALLIAGCSSREASIPALPRRLSEQQLIDKASGGVVAIKARGRLGVSTGTGFVVDASRGLVMTAAHVIGASSNLKVRLPDRTTRPARVVGQQVCGDIALLQVVGDAPSLRTLPLGDGTPLPRNSDTVLLHFGASAVQNFGRQGMASSPLTVANPVVERPDLPSGIAPVERLFQVQGVVPEGASGGAVLDADGRVVGMAILGETDESQAYALPAGAIRAALPPLRGGTRQDLLGLSGESVRDADIGDVFADVFGPGLGRVLVQDFRARGGFFVWDAGGAAERAGIRAGDLITEVNGTAVRSMRGVCGVLESASPGELLTVSGVHPVSSHGYLDEFRRTVRAPR